MRGTKGGKSAPKLGSTTTGKVGPIRTPFTGRVMTGKGR